MKTEGHDLEWRGIDSGTFKRRLALYPNRVISVQTARRGRGAGTYVAQGASARGVSSGLQHESSVIESECATHLRATRFPARPALS